MDAIEQIIVEPFQRFYEKIIEFLPNLLAALVILIIGFVFAGILKWVFLKIFRSIDLDKYFQRLGIMGILRKSGIDDPFSVLLSKVIKWTTVVVFVIISLYTLNSPTVERLLESFFFYLPSVFVAALILLFGYVLSNFIGRAALIASVNAGIKVSGLIGKLVKLTIFLLAVTMALEQLGIGKGTIIIAFTLVFGGIVLALAIAFGLGGKEVAKSYLEKKMKGEEKGDEISHL
jgi:hypothetical protein